MSVDGGSDYEFDASELEINAAGALKVLKGVINTRASISRRFSRLHGEKMLSTADAKRQEELLGSERQELRIKSDVFKDLIRVPGHLAVSSWAEYIDREAAAMLRAQGEEPLDMPPVEEL